MHDCIVNLWPHLTDEGYVFFDEYVHLHNCSLFFSERFWRDYLDTTPPGLMGTGTGVGFPPAGVREALTGVTALGWI